MRTKIKLIVSVIFMTLSTITYAGESSDEITMTKIEQNTAQTASNTQLGTFDYLTIVVTIAAFIVALITLFFAKVTKDLQEMTERNTRRVSLKHERTTLRHMSWKLLKAYNNLCTIEGVINEGLSPATINFRRMMIDISSLHIYDSFDIEIPNRGIQLLYKLQSQIEVLNNQLERRCDQAEFLTIKNNYNIAGYRLSDFHASLESEAIWHTENNVSKRIYFSEEKESIKSILYTVDELYPLLFSAKEYNSDTTDRKLDIVKNAHLVYADCLRKDVIPYSENYVCRSSVTLDSCRDILDIEDSDKYFSLLFVYYYNKVRDALNKHKISSEMIIEDTDLSQNNPDILSDKHRLPVNVSYIEKVLSVISSEVGSTWTLENRDIFVSRESRDTNTNERQIEVSSVVVDKVKCPENETVDVYDPVSNTLYLYADKKHFEGAVYKKIFTYNYYLDSYHLPLFFQHDNAKILCVEGCDVKSFKEGIIFLTKEKKIPYLKNDIQNVTLTYVANGCKDLVTFKVRKIKFSSQKEDEKIKVSLTLGDIIHFERK